LAAWYSVWQPVFFSDEGHAGCFRLTGRKVHVYIDRLP
jgi:hypothetical protein